jgi:hypothetical protein
MKIFHGDTVSENLQRFRSIAECFGIAADLVKVRPDPGLTGALKQAVEHGDSGIVVDVESLKDRASEQELKEIANFLLQHDAVALLLATASDDGISQFVRALTGGRVGLISRAPSAGRVGFPAAGRSFSRELCSQSYARQEKEALSITQDATTTPIMELDGKPVFVAFTAGKSQIMVWSTASVFDIHRPLGAEKEFELATDEYIPAIIFLRSAFRDQCWHNPEAAAGIVIDDPLLQKRYGCIDFGELLESARKHSYHITLAFIPWNHWRSRSSEIRLFLDHLDCFSICAHGCDHIDNEYGSTDYDLLLRKNFVASERMNRHGRRTGLPSEALMVCPQEKYSIEAMGAFSDSRQFLGLICTACMPRNLALPQLSAADLLLPAQDSFFGFSVFKRHYSGNMAVFAMALFLGKPAILVEHHEFFKNGLGSLEEFVRNLALLRPDIKWRSLAENVTRTHARRRVSDREWEVRLFTDTFELEHRSESPINYGLLRRVPDTAVVNRVLVDGAEVPFNRTAGFLSITIEAHLPHVFVVQVEVTPVYPRKTYPRGIRYQTSVAMRRALSEIRDNLIVRNRFTRNAGRVIVKTVKNRIRQQSGSLRP